MPTVSLELRREPPLGPDLFFRVYDQGSYTFRYGGRNISATNLSRCAVVFFLSRDLRLGEGDVVLTPHFEDTLDWVFRSPPDITECILADFTPLEASGSTRFEHEEPV